MMRSETQKQAFNSQSTRLFVGAFVIALITFFAYLPVLQGGFLLDDDLLLTNNPLIKDPFGFFRFWWTTQTPDYLPVMSDSFWLEWRLWGLNPAGYHVTNLILHIIAVIILWRILVRLRVPGAWLIALVFAVHPVTVRSVAWIAERKNTLSLVFFLLSLLVFLKYETTLRRREYALSLLLFALALLSKASVVVLPGVLLILAWWRRGAISGEDVRRTAPYFALSLISGLIAIWFQYNREIKPKDAVSDPFLWRLAGAGWDVWFYLGKILAPINLSLIYHRWLIDTANPTSYLPLLFVLAGLVLLWRFRGTKAQPIFVAALYFGVTLLPVLGFINIAFFKSSLVSDHLQYIPMIGVITLLVGGASAWYQKQGSRMVRWGGYDVAGLVIATFCILTWRQAALYRSQVTLAADTLLHNPDSFWAHGTMSNAALVRGDLGTAISELQEALRLNPQSADAHNNLGAIFMEQGRLPEAASQCQAAVTIHPDRSLFHHNLADILLQMGKSADAADQYREVVRLDPGDVSARKQLDRIAAGRTQ